MPGANYVRQAEPGQTTTMNFGVQACMPIRNAGLHPDNTRLGNGFALLQLTLPEIRGANLDGPGEVKVKPWPGVQSGRISAQ